MRAAALDAESGSSDGEEIELGAVGGQVLQDDTVSSSSEVVYEQEARDMRASDTSLVSISPDSPSVLPAPKISPKYAPHSSGSLQQRRLRSGGKKKA